MCGHSGPGGLGSTAERECRRQVWQIPSSARPAAGVPVNGRLLNGRYVISAVFARIGLSAR